MKDVSQKLAAMMDEATSIVDFFEIWDERRRVRRDIIRAIIAEFNDVDLMKMITDLFMKLAEVKLR